MSFSVGVPATEKSAFDAAVDALTVAGLNEEAQSFLDVGKETAKTIAAKFDNPDAFLAASISGHGCGAEENGSPFDSLSVYVYETAATT